MPIGNGDSGDIGKVESATVEAVPQGVYARKVLIVNLLQSADNALRELKGLEIEKSLRYGDMLSIVMTYEELCFQK